MITLTHYAVEQKIAKMKKDLEKEWRIRLRQAYQDGVKIGRAEVLTAIRSATHNIERKYGEEK